MQFLLISFVFCIATRQSFADISAINSRTGKTTVVYGGDYNYPPFEYLDKNGKPAGFNVELLQLIGEATGLEVDVRLGPWPQIWEEFKEGKIDIIGLFYMQEREKFFNFAIPHAILYHMLFSRKSEKPFIALDDLKGYTVIVQEDTYLYSTLLKLNKDIDFILVKSEPEALQMLALGKGDYALVGRIAGYHTIEKYHLANIAAASPPLLPAEYRFTVHHGNTALLNSINRGLTYVITEGILDNLDKKYLQKYRTLPTVAEALRKTAWILSVLFLVIGIVLLWLFSLKKLVARQTKQLREDIEKIRQSEKQISHLNRVLQAIRNVNQLIVRESVPSILIKKSVEILVETRGYKTALIVLLDNNGVPSKYSQSGFGNEFKKMEEFLKKGKLPSCYEIVLSHRGVYTVTDRSKDCINCPLAEECPSDKSLCIHISYGGKIYGFAAFGLPAEFFDAPEEKSLLTEMVDDIGYALHSIEETGKKQKSEEYIRSILKLMPDIIIRTNRECEYLDIITYSENKLARPKTELLGKKVSDVLPEKDAVRIKNSIEKALDTKSLQMVEYELKTPSGYLWFEARILPLNRNEVFALIRDITELKQTEENYRSLFEDTKDIIYTFTPEGKFLDINPAGIQTFGYAAKEEMLKLDMGKDIYWNPEDRTKFKTLLEKDSFIKDYELEMRNKTGDKLIMRLTATVVKNEKGNIIAYRVIARDITEQKQLGQQLIQTEKMAALGELISGVAHEINNPLTAMIGFTELLLTEKPEQMQEELRKDLEKIHSASLRVYQITTGLLKFARKEKPVKKDVRINELLEETLSMKEYQLRVKNIVIEKMFQEDLPYVNADANQIAQVFLNLINNAEYAMAEMPGEKTLTIRTSLYDKYVKIEFMDTGPGIPEEIIRKVFDPFFTTKPREKGTGLGLSVSYGIIKEHGGKTYAENRRKGGAVFVILLPVTGENGN